MPRKKRNGLFDFLKPRTTIYHVKRKRVKPTLLSSKIRSLGSHRIVKVGDHYEVPSLDRGSWFDTREDAQRFIREMKKYNPKRKRNLEVGLPKNQFVNAKVRVKGGNIQIMADQSVLGKAGFKAGAGLRGVSVSGGAKLNPKERISAKGFEELVQDGMSMDKDAGGPARGRRKYVVGYLKQQYTIVKPKRKRKK